MTQEVQETTLPKVLPNPGSYTYPESHYRIMGKLANSCRVSESVKGEAKEIHGLMLMGQATPEEVARLFDKTDLAPAPGCMKSCCYVECCCGETEDLECCLICGASWTCPVWCPLLIGVAFAGIAGFLGTLGCFCMCCGGCGGQCCKHGGGFCDHVGRALAKCGYCSCYCCLPPDMGFEEFKQVL